MIVNVDAKGLEWVAGTYLCQDKTAIKEIWDGFDNHADNQRLFNLPSRLIAKKFVFRLIYGGTEYSYSVDPDFASVGGSAKFWKDVIDKFYDKYRGWAAWHIKLMQEATTTSRIVMPTGRVYQYERDRYHEWPRTTILNYPVQGLGADLMAIVRVAFYKRLKQRKLNGIVISSVHDSIVCDCPKEEVEEFIALYKEAFEAAPALFKAWFGVEFNLPLNAEISVGENMSELTEIGNK